MSTDRNLASGELRSAMRVFLLRPSLLPPFRQNTLHLIQLPRDASMCCWNITPNCSPIPLIRKCDRENMRAVQKTRKHKLLQTIANCVLCSTPANQIISVKSKCKTKNPVHKLKLKLGQRLDAYTLHSHTNRAMVLGEEKARDDKNSIVASYMHLLFQNIFDVSEPIRI